MAQSFRPATASAGEELRAVLRLTPLWVHMAWQDIRGRYRGSLLGPLWVAGGIAAASLGAGVLFSRVLSVDARQLIPFVTVGIAVWTLISLSLTEACHAFVGSATLIRNTALPLPLHVLRVLTRNLIVFAHGLVVVALVLLLFGVPLRPVSLLAIPGLVLLVLNLFWLSVVFALLAARYRDVIQLVFYGLQFALFVTPIFWYPDLAGRTFVGLRFNPFYHLIELVRAPLLGRWSGAENWTVCTIGAVLGLMVAAAVYGRARPEVPKWL